MNYSYKEFFEILETWVWEPGVLESGTLYQASPAFPQLLSVKDSTP